MKKAKQIKFMGLMLLTLSSFSLAFAYSTIMKAWENEENASRASEGILVPPFEGLPKKAASCEKGLDLTFFQDDSKAKPLPLKRPSYKRVARLAQFQRHPLPISEIFFKKF